jgi:predicted kinase
MHGKVLVLLRGVPGAGKSSFANFVWNSGVIFEADKFFDTPDGGYKFDGAKLKEAHEWCRARTEDTMKHGYNIVVSNTFTMEWEMAPYFELAEKYGYQTSCLIVENRHNGENVHGCPVDKIKQMEDRFEIKLY